MKILFNIEDKKNPTLGVGFCSERKCIILPTRPVDLGEEWECKIVKEAPKYILVEPLKKIIERKYYKRSQSEIGIVDVYLCSGTRDLGTEIVDYSSLVVKEIVDNQILHKLTIDDTLLVWTETVDPLQSFIANMLAFGDKDFITEYWNEIESNYEALKKELKEELNSKVFTWQFKPRDWDAGLEDELSWRPGLLEIDSPDNRVIRFPKETVLKCSKRDLPTGYYGWWESSEYDNEKDDVNRRLLEYKLAFFDDYYRFEEGYEGEHFKALELVFNKLASK